MSAFKRNLKRIWDETGTPVGEEGPRNGQRRYVVRAFNDGGYGWSVWDKRRDRFLKDREIAALTENQITETWTQ